jgi:LAGLIDADG-like domain
MSEEIAWAAGLFEGEGCFSRSRNRGQVIACISMADRDVMERFAKIIGRGRLRKVLPRQPHHKPIYRLDLAGYDNLRYLYRLFEPWLGERRKQKVEWILAQQPPPLVRRNVPPSCGLTTPNSGSGAVSHERKGERPCDDCAKARNAYMRELRTRRTPVKRVRPPWPPDHPRRMPEGGRS